MKKNIILLIFICCFSSLYSWKTPEYLSEATNFPGSISNQVAMNSQFKTIVAWNSFDGFDYSIQAAIYYLGSWSSPMEISKGNSIRRNVQVAINDDGDAVVIYDHTTDAGNSYVYASTYHGVNWSTKLLSSNSSEETFPQVTINSDGDGIATWNYKTGATYKIQSSNLNGDDWSTVNDISSGESIRRNVQIDMNNDGKAVIIYDHTTQENNSFIYVTTYDGAYWSDPSSLASNAYVETFPQVAMNSDGNAIATWNAYTNPSYKINVSNFNGSDWSEPYYIESGTPVYNYPQIAMGDDGKAIIVYEAVSLSGYYLVLGSTYDGDDWSSPLVLSQNSDTHTYPKVGINLNGQATVAWNYKSGNTYKIQTRKFDGVYWDDTIDISSGNFLKSNCQISTDNGEDNVATIIWFTEGYVQGSINTDDSWKISENLSSGTNFNDCQVAMNELNHGIAVWNFFDGSSYKIQVSFFDGNNWSANSDISSGSSYRNNVQVAFNDSDEAVVVYNQTTTAQNTYVYAVHYDGDDWSPPTILSSSSDYLTTPQVVINDDGNAIAVWNFLTGSTYKIQTKNFNGSNWSPVSDIASGEPIKRNPRISMNDSNEAVVVYNQAPLTTTNYVYALVFDGTYWSNPTQLSTSTNIEMFPNVDMNSDGDAIAAWNYKTGSTYKIQSSNFDGSDWSSANDITSGLSIRQNIQIAMNDSNKAILVFDLTTSSQTSYVWKANFNGNDWTSADYLSVISSSENTTPSLSMNHLNYAYVVWNYKSSNTYKVQSANFNGTTWISNDDISSTSTSPTTPKVNINNNNDDIAVWKFGDAIQASNLENSPPI